MNKASACRLLDQTFKSHFDGNRFTRFIKELFNNFDIHYKTFPIGNEYLHYVDSAYSLGSYVDASKDIIDVLGVKLKRTSSRDRARAMQRNFIAKYLTNTGKDAALVAFYGDDEDWRFSFVKLEHNLYRSEQGKIKTQLELTPAKRFSYLVGVNEPNHTCENQFLKLLMEEEKNPCVEDIEEAFSVDNVTKEFFLKY